MQRQLELGGFQAVRGADQFVFAPDNGEDTIHDFEQGTDHIDLTAFGFSNIDALAISDDGTNSVIDFGGNWHEADAQALRCPVRN